VKSQPRAAENGYPSPISHCHLVGIAGVGMSALAELLVALGYRVSGSDRHLDRGGHTAALGKLCAMGVTLCPQDGAGVISDAVTVIVSTAIEPDNADLVAARRRGCRVLHRAAMLGALARGKRCLAVTGTSGKTTVTGMIAWVLETVGADPTVVNGGVLLNWAEGPRLGCARAGSSDLWIVEADESDRSLLHFHPHWAVITNISKDHFELDEVKGLFAAFARQTVDAVICGPGVRDAIRRGVETQRLVEHPFAPGGAGFDFEGVAFETALPGCHNRENAFVAAAACRELGVAPAAAAAALKSFRGIQRRLEEVGCANGIRVIDDYAHNPDKLGAAWAAVASGAKRVLGVWRPHGYRPLAVMHDELAHVLSRACRRQDRLYLLPVFYAGGTVSPTVSVEDLVHALQARGVNAERAGDYSTLASTLARTARPGDAILSMGARDPELPRFARKVFDMVSGAVDST